MDTLIFAGGIGENAPVVRSRICAGLEFLGIEIDEKRNTAKNAGVISTETGRVPVRVIHTDEEWMIAKKPVCRILKLKIGKEHDHEKEKNKPLSPDIAAKRMDAYWRAANYLSVGQIYLFDNPPAAKAAEEGAHQADVAGALGHDVRARILFMCI